MTIRGPNDEGLVDIYVVGSDARAVGQARDVIEELVPQFPFIWSLHAQPDPRNERDSSIRIMAFAIREPAPEAAGHPAGDMIGTALLEPRTPFIATIDIDRDRDPWTREISGGDERDFGAFIETVVRLFLPMLRPGVLAPSEHELRAAIEILLSTVERQILTNEGLLRVLAERDQIIEQLEGQVATLQAELRRHKIDAQRVRGPVDAIRTIIATAVISAATSFGAGFGAAKAATPPAPAKIVVEQPGADGDALRAVVEACVAAEHAANDLEGQ